MKKFYSRKTPRAQRYDYHSAGMYFVTICTQDRVHYFGEIVDKKMILSDIGNICDEQLQIMLQKRPSIDMHEYVIMPNHVHLLFWMGECRDTGLPCPINENKNQTKKDEAEPSSLQIQQSIITNQTLGSVIGGRKSAVSKQCTLQGLPFARQSRYHDHIVRDEGEYDRIKYYIQTNPDKRGEDTHYTDA